jgi:drug/metabolite transporter (DMT)-like permease
VGLPPRDYLLFLLLGIIPSHCGHTLYNYLLRFLEANIIAVSTLGEPIISSILALVILGETPSQWIILGGPLVLVGIYVTVRGSFNRGSARRDRDKGAYPWQTRQ